MKLRFEVTGRDNPGFRLWLGAPPHSLTPAWIQDQWERHGRPIIKGAHKYEAEGRALLWFANQWLPSRAPYDAVLPLPLIDWLNAPEIDLAHDVIHRPGLCGAIPCAASKPVSRFMVTAAEQYGFEPATLRDSYYEFLSWYLFTFVPQSHIARALVPGAIIDLLNQDAAGGDVPITCGMLLFLKSAYPAFVEARPERERLLSLSYCAVEGVLSSGHSRLIPSHVSNFWRQRPGAVATAFEHVAAAANGAIRKDAAQSGPVPEATVRTWFLQQLPGNSGLAVMSGPPVQFAPPEPPEPVLDTAVLVYRDHDTVCGLSRAGENTRNTLLASGIPVFDLHHSLLRSGFAAERDRNISVRINARRKMHILHLNPENVCECCFCNIHRLGLNDYLIGQFYWELSRVSKVHEAGIAMVDEIWTASQYLADIYSAATARPVLNMGQAVIPTAPSGLLDRAAFGYAKDTYLFLSSFDVTSIIERKNPLAAIMAFQQAFPRQSDSVGLIIKTHNLDNVRTDADRLHWARAAEKIERDNRIRVIDERMSDSALAALYRMCDCFVSLHRSEGFGFGPAEAMAHGRTAIVTNYSGVCDFCTPSTAKLVPYNLIRVNRDEYPFLDSDRGYEWADPDVNVAADCMRELAEDRAQSARLGDAARELIASRFSVRALSQRYMERITALGFAETARAVVNSQC